MPHSGSRVPMRWRSGGPPLSSLAGSPVNCLVVDSALDAETAIEAERLKIAVVRAASVAGVSKPVWPGIPVSRAGESASAGPTGVPWVDSNGWRCLLAKAKNPDDTPWVSVAPPTDTALRPEAYAVAIADAAAHGGRWIVDVDESTWHGLGAREPAAVQTWKAVMRALAFAEERRELAEMPAAARFGIVSDFAGKNEAVAAEVLNLAGRRPLAYRAIARTHMTPQLLEGLRALVWIDSQLPDGEMEQALREFAAGGGLLILPAAGGKLTGAAKRVGTFEARFAVYAAGKGRIAVAAKPWSDPWLLAADSHLLLGRKHDVLRAWNAGSCNLRFTANASKGALHVVNYTGRQASEPISAYVARRFKSATWSEALGSLRVPLRVMEKADGVEVHLPPFAVYGVVEYGV